MFFDNSSAKRAKRSGKSRMTELIASPIPPANSYELLNDDEIYNKSLTLVFDTESFPNYWLAAFKDISSGKCMFFEDSPDNVVDIQKLSFVLYRHKLIGFNSNNYDLILIQLALLGNNAEKLKQVTNEIIIDGKRAWDLREKYNLRIFNINHIDLIEVAPVKASLKLYAGRIHCPRMQDLPYSPDMFLSKEQAKNVRDYCINDLDNTELLYKELLPQIHLRETLSTEYSMDLRSKSDAQIAEAILGHELEKLRSYGWRNAANSKAKIEPGFTFRYKIPEFVTFKTRALQNVLEAVRTADFVVGQSGAVAIPEAISGQKITIGDTIYQLGGGGLHSCESSIAQYANDNHYLIDRDVSSYYPSIILNQGLYPQHLGKDFLRVYQTIVTRRLQAKLEKNKVVADALKITINGTFGKLGSPYSKLYAPDLCMQVTISGQLCLLMLIENIELAGIHVVSANTDGIVTRCPKDRYNDFLNIVLQWESITGFSTEEVRYKAIFSRDVNNYIAIKENNELKVKGIYSDKGSALNSPLSKNPECQIISDAVQAFLAHGVSVVETIMKCTDIHKFVSVRTVKGGAAKDGCYLGKAIRWYYAKNENGTINCVQSGNKVPKTEGARPLMILPASIPEDLDYDYYITEAKNTLYDIGFLQRENSNLL